MMAPIIAGTILSNMASSWESAKYLFTVNLNLPTYLKDHRRQLKACICFFPYRLAIWAIAALIVSFTRLYEARHLELK